MDGYRKPSMKHPPLPSSTDFRHNFTVQHERPSPVSPPISPDYIPRLTIACPSKSSSTRQTWGPSLAQKKVKKMTFGKFEWSTSAPNLNNKIVTSTKCHKCSNKLCNNSSSGGSYSNSSKLFGSNKSYNKCTCSKAHKVKFSSSNNRINFTASTSSALAFSVNACFSRQLSHVTKLLASSSSTTFQYFPLFVSIFQYFSLFVSIFQYFSLFVSIFQFSFVFFHCFSVLYRLPFHREPKCSNQILKI